jgi:hypothetical protein
MVMSAMTFAWRAPLGSGVPRQTTRPPRVHRRGGPGAADAHTAPSGAWLRLGHVGGQAHVVVGAEDRLASDDQHVSKRPLGTFSSGARRSPIETDRVGGRLAVRPSVSVNSRPRARIRPQRATKAGRNPVEVRVEGSTEGTPATWTGLRCAVPFLSGTNVARPPGGRAGQSN